MAAKKKKKKGLSQGNIAAQNRKAYHDFAIEEKFEAGIQLYGTEVKSLRQGRATIAESYAAIKGGELYLLNSYIPEYAAASHFSHDPRRPRKLLMHKREIGRLMGAVNRQGMTIVPLSIYFNTRGIAKISIALARGKQKADKRASEKARDWSRQKARLMSTRR